MYALPTFSSSALPPPIQEGQRRWAQAEKDVQSGRWLSAARRFMEAAVQFRQSSPELAELALSARALAYENAASCWLAGNATEQGRRLLAEALRTDPAAADAISTALTRLPSDKN